VAAAAAAAVVKTAKMMSVVMVDAMATTCETAAATAVTPRCRLGDGFRLNDGAVALLASQGGVSGRQRR